MDNVITFNSAMSRVSTNGFKLIIVGVLVDLHMKNGWDKRNEFVPINYDQAQEFMQMLEKKRGGEFRFESKLIDANNQVKKVEINVYALYYGNSGISKDSTQLPDQLEIRCGIEDGSIGCSNARFMCHLSAGCQVLGNDYANGDFLIKNVMDPDARGNHF